MIDFKKNNSQDEIPCTWRLLKDGYRKSASIVCPNGHYGILLDHNIDENGMVTPSVVCPEEGCNFHDWIKLMDWWVS